MKSAEPVPPKPGKSPKNVVSLPERRVERREITPGRGFTKVIEDVAVAARRGALDLLPGARYADGQHISRRIIQSSGAMSKRVG